VFSTVPDNHVIRSQFSAIQRAIRSLIHETLMRARMSKYDSRLQLVHISWERIERISAITGSWKFDSKLEAHQRTNSRGGSDPARQESCLHDRTKLLSEDQLESLKTRRSDLRGSDHQSDSADTQLRGTKPY